MQQSSDAHPCWFVGDLRLRQRGGRAEASRGYGLLEMFMRMSRNITIFSGVMGFVIREEVRGVVVRAHERGLEYFTTKNAFHPWARGRTTVVGSLCDAPMLLAFCTASPGSL